MKKNGKRFKEEQIIYALQQVEGGRKIAEARGLASWPNAQQAVSNTTNTQSKRKILALPLA